MVERQIGVRQGLRLHALGGVHDEHRALTGRERTGDLIVEVHVTRGVDQVDLVDLAVVGLVVHGDRARLDGDAALALEVHVVEQLLLHLTLGDRLALFEQAVGKGGLAVVDVRDDREVSDILLMLHDDSPSQSLDS